MSRAPEPDSYINADEYLVDDTVARRAAIRSVNQPQQILHAVISCKWTLRSDRAQNARSEALNLIRNRKGRLPHIAVVTGEPTPSRRSSLALGTGDIDAVYHFALPELIAAVDEVGSPDAIELLAMMVEGKRLKGIADLPLDLTVGTPLLRPRDRAVEASLDSATPAPGPGRVGLFAVSGRHGWLL